MNGQLGAPPTPWRRCRQAEHDGSTPHILFRQPARAQHSQGARTPAPVPRPTPIDPRTSAPVPPTRIQCQPMHTRQAMVVVLVVVVVPWSTLSWHHRHHEHYHRPSSLFLCHHDHVRPPALLSNASTASDMTTAGAVGNLAVEDCLSAAASDHGASAIVVVSSDNAVSTGVTLMFRCELTLRHRCHLDWYRCSDRRGRRPAGLEHEGRRIRCWRGRELGG